MTRPRTRPNVLACGIFLLPVLLSLWAWAETQGHGDGAVYRMAIDRLVREGHLVGGPMEWYHPGHYLMLAPVHALGLWLGLWHDPLRAVNLVNFLALGWLAVTVHRTWTVVLGESSGAVAALAGIAVGSCPGALWWSQECMSDVVGHAFVLVTACRLLQHAARTETRWHPYLVTGFLFAWAGLIRVSSGLFLPLMGYLVLRCLVGQSWPHRRRVVLGVLFGGLLPIVAIFGYLYAEYGTRFFVEDYFSFSADNQQSLDRLLDLDVRRWLGHLWTGMGASLAVAVVGLGVLLTCFRRRGWLREPGSAALLILLTSLGYTYGVIMNRANYEFRYQLPHMLLLGGLCLPFAGMWLQRLLGVRAVWLLAVILAGANVVHAAPLLHWFRTTQNFTDVGTGVVARHAAPGTLVVGYLSFVFYENLVPERDVVPVWPFDVDPSPSPVFLSWPAARDVLCWQALRGGRILTFNEHPLRFFSEWLAAEGFRRREVQRIDRKQLRNRREQMMDSMDEEQFAVLEDLVVAELLPPTGLKHAVTLTATTAPGDPRGMVLTVHAPRHAGLYYGVLVGQRRDDGNLRFGPIQLPLALDDPRAALCMAVWATPHPAAKNLFGQLDEKGEARIAVPGEYARAPAGHIAIAVIFQNERDRHQNPRENPTMRSSARTASAPLALSPR